MFAGTEVVTDASPVAPSSVYVREPTAASASFNRDAMALTVDSSSVRRLDWEKNPRESSE